MRSVRASLLRLGGLLRKKQTEREFDAEMETHLKMHIEDNLRAGMTAQEARRNAVIKLVASNKRKKTTEIGRGCPSWKCSFRIYASVGACWVKIKASRL